MTFHPAPIPLPIPIPIPIPVPLTVMPYVAEAAVAAAVVKY